MFGKNRLQSALVIRQELRLLEKNKVVFVSKLSNNIVDIMLIVGVP
jgi:hypothetical protein